MSKKKKNLQQVKQLILCLDENSMERLFASMPLYLGYNFEIYFLIHFPLMELNVCNVYQRKNLCEI